MLVYEYRDPQWGRAFSRISDALHKHSPERIEWVDHKSCEVALVHVVGGGEVKVIQSALDNYKKVVIFQHCYFTSMYDHWLDYWKQSNLTLSFHDLQSYTPEKFNFYSTPLGADTDTFRLINQGDRPLKAFTTGHVASTENIDKIYQACNLTGNTLYHTGENFRYGHHYQFMEYMNDSAFVGILNNTQYIPCLREIEGFEMMGVEGLFCGARPIVPNLPTYRWYEGHAEFVDTQNNLLNQLVEIFNREPKPLTSDEYYELDLKFSWRNIVKNIFSKIEESI
jgi:hypothetical protein